MTRVDQQHRETARLEQFEQGNPVNAGRFHGDGVDFAGCEPVGNRIEVHRETGKFAHRRVVSIRRHGHKMGRAPNIDTGGVGVG